MCNCGIPLRDDSRPAPWFVVPTPAGESILAQFNAGQVTSDGGLLWLAQADRELELGESLARCLPEWRREPPPRLFEHVRVLVDADENRLWVALE